MQTYTLTYTLEVHDEAKLCLHLADHQSTATLLELLGSVDLDLGGLDVGCEVVDRCVMPEDGSGLARLETVAKPRALGAELERVAGGRCARCGGVAASACTWCEPCQAAYDRAGKSDVDAKLFWRHGWRRHS